MAGLQKIVKQALSLRTGSILRDKGLSWSICRGVKLSLATAADKEREETSTGLNISDSCVKVRPRSVTFSLPLTPYMSTPSNLCISRKEKMKVAC